MRWILSAFPVLALLAGCEKAVIVESPDSHPNAPVTEISVRFSDHFKVGTFTARLDGKDITALFAPAPIPGGRSSAQIPGLECGFEGGETVPPSPPPPMRSVVVENRPADQSPSSGAVPSQPPPQSGTGGTATVPPPPAGLPVFWHRIVVDGDCSMGRICEGDERPFLPLHLVGVPGKLPIYMSAQNVAERNLFHVTSWPASSVSIGAKLKPETGSVARIRLNGGGPDAPVSTTVPAGSRSPDIAIEGLVAPTQYVIRICAPGTQRGTVSGTISRR